MIEDSTSHWPTTGPAYTNNGVHLARASRNAPE
jgi:hypothetical protein